MKKRWNGKGWHNPSRRPRSVRLHRTPSFARLAVFNSWLDKEGKKQQRRTENHKYDSNFIPEVHRGDTFMKQTDNHLPMQNNMQQQEAQEQEGQLQMHCAPGMPIQTQPGLPYRETSRRR